MAKSRSFCRRYPLRSSSSSSSSSSRSRSRSRSSRSRSRSRSRSPPLLISDYEIRQMCRAKRDISPSHKGLLPLDEEFTVKRFESIAMELRSGRKLATTCPCCLGKGSNANIFRWCRKCFKERVRGPHGRKVYGDPLRRVSVIFPPRYVPDPANPAKFNRIPYSEEDADVWVHGVLVHSRKKKDGKKNKDGQAIGDQSGCGPAKVDELTGATKEGTKKDEQANGDQSGCRPAKVDELTGVTKEGTKKDEQANGDQSGCSSAKVDVFSKIIKDGEKKGGQAKGNQVGCSSARVGRFRKKALVDLSESMNRQMETKVDAVRPNW